MIKITLYLCADTLAVHRRHQHPLNSRHCHRPCPKPDYHRPPHALQEQYCHQPIGCLHCCIQLSYYNSYESNTHIVSYKLIRRTLANNSNIFRVGTVVDSYTSVRTVKQGVFSSSAAQIIQKNISSSPAKCSTAPSSCICIKEAIKCNLRCY